MGSSSHDISYRDFQEFVYPPIYHMRVVILAKDQGLHRGDFLSFLWGKAKLKQTEKGDTHFTKSRNGNKRQEKCRPVDHLKTHLETSKVQRAELKI